MVTENNLDQGSTSFHLTFFLFAVSQSKEVPEKPKLRESAFLVRLNLDAL